MTNKLLALYFCLALLAFASCQTNDLPESQSSNSSTSNYESSHEILKPGSYSEASEFEEIESVPERYLPFQGEWQVVSMEGAVTKEFTKPEIFVSVTGQRFEFSGSSFKESRGPFEFQIPETDIDSPFRELQKHGVEGLDDIIDVKNQIMVFWYVGIFKLTDDKLHLALKYCGQGVEGVRFKTFRPPSSFDEQPMEGEIRITLERKKK